MRVRSQLWRVSAALVGVVLSGTLISPATASAPPDQLALPDGFQPESIAVGPGGTAYLGSRADGDIFALNLRTGEGSVISEGQDGPAFGLKADQQRRLFVAGGPTGTGRVVDVRTGAVVKTYQFTGNSRFINDVVLTKTYAWFTDSRQPVLHGVPLGPGGAPGDPVDVVTLPLRGEWEQIGGANNANGIAETPNRQALLVVDSAAGALFRVDPATGVTTRVDLGGYELTNGDGLLVVGTTAYVVQNRLNQVAVLKLNAAGTAGSLVDTLRSDAFDVPTAVAAFGSSLYLPNARFGQPPDPAPAFWVARVDRT